MYYVLNTMSAVGEVNLGTVLSGHRTIEAAVKGARACQPRERGSYVPTRIVAAERRVAKGEGMSASWVRALTESEIYDRDLAASVR